LQRILVIKNVGLWISLNRHFAGQDSIAVTDATSLDMGIRLAQVERPNLVVCSTDSIGHSPSELGRLFGEAQLDDLPIVCVRDPGSAFALTRNDGDNLCVCAPDEFVDAVERVVKAPSATAARALVELLAHFELQLDHTEEPLRGFVNLLEMDSSSLLVESSQALDDGDQLDLSFFLPRLGSDSSSQERVHVALSCQVSRCDDKHKLLYTAKIRKIDKESEAAFHQFVNARASGRESAV